MDFESGTWSARIKQLTDRHFASWSGEMVLLLEQGRLLSIVHEKEVLSAPTAARTSKAAKDKAAQFWQRHGVAGSTMSLEMTPGVRSKYSSILGVVQLWKKLKEDYAQKVRRDIWSLRAELTAVWLAEELEIRHIPQADPKNGGGQVLLQPVLGPHDSITCPASLPTCDSQSRGMGRTDSRSREGTSGRPQVGTAPG
jgi:hypothetical protein